jgi:hypothetical protein
MLAEIREVAGELQHGACGPVQIAAGRPGLMKQQRWSSEHQRRR